MATVLDLWITGLDCALRTCTTDGREPPLLVSVTSYELVLSIETVSLWPKKGYHICQGHTMFLTAGALRSGFFVSRDGALSTWMIVVLLASLSGATAAMLRICSCGCTVLPIYLEGSLISIVEVFCLGSAATAAAELP